VLRAVVGDPDGQVGVLLQLVAAVLRVGRGVAAVTAEVGAHLGVTVAAVRPDREQVRHTVVLQTAGDHHATVLGVLADGNRVVLQPVHRAVLGHRHPVGRVVVRVRLAVHRAP